MIPALTLLPLFGVLILDGCDRAPGATPARNGQDPGGAVSGPEVSARRIWVLHPGGDFSFRSSSPSPDGRYVTEFDRSTGDLAVRDLESGALHRLTDKGSWEESGDYADHARFSPDGGQIAYTWYVNGPDSYELRVLDFDVDDSGAPRGSKLRTLLSDQEYLELYGWSPEHEILALTYQPGGTTTLAAVSAGSGAIQGIRSFGWDSPEGAAFSADGRLLAYDRLTGEDPAERDIYLVVDRERESLLVQGPGKDEVVGWLGGDLLFLSNRSGSPCLWRQPVEDGRASGSPVLVREDTWNLVPLGFSRDALCFGVSVEQPTYRTAIVDVEGGGLTALPTVFADPDGSPVLRLDWSPDGEHVVYQVKRPGRTGIVVRAAAGEIVKEMRFDLAVSRRMGFRWSPDGRSVVFHAFDPRGALRRLDLESGELTILRRFQLDGDSMQGDFALAPDGRSLSYSRATLADEPTGERPDEPASTAAFRDRTVFELVQLDLATGSERSMHRLAGGAMGLEYSPDGALLAFATDDPEVPRGFWSVPGKQFLVEVLPIAGGEPRVLYRNERALVFGGTAGWTPDGRWLLFFVEPEQAGPAELWRVSRAGGDAEKLAEIPYFAGGGRLNPDGRTLTFRAGERRAEIWALDGLTGGAR